MLYLNIIKFVGHFNCESFQMAHDNIIKEIAIQIKESKELQKYKKEQ